MQVQKRGDDEDIPLPGHDGQANSVLEQDPGGSEDEHPGPVGQADSVGQADPSVGTWFDGVLDNPD